MGMWLLLAATASATWSIVAVDEATSEVGIAGAACGPSAWGIAGLAPGKGVVAAQGATWPGGRDMATAMLEDERSPSEVRDALDASDTAPDLRQYGVVALGADGLGWTGADVEGDATVAAGDGYSAQGETLASIAVVTETEAAFLATVGSPLDARLVAALEAGAAAGGDARCAADVASRSAFLYVAKADDRPDDPTVEVRADGARAVSRLAERWADGRHGCHTATGTASLLLSVAGLAALARRRLTNV